MTFSTLTDQVRQSTQYSPRQGADIDMFLFHGQASTSDDTTISMMVNRTRQVSANYTVSNEGRITGVVPEEFRAWTSGSTTDGGKGAAFDRRAITVEIENATGAPGWTFSAAAEEAVARLLADCSKRHNIPLDRDHCVGHRELYTRWGASYATACPQALDMNGIVARAKELREGNVMATETEKQVAAIYKETTQKLARLDTESAASRTEDTLLGHARNAATLSLAALRVAEANAAALKRIEAALKAPTPVPVVIDQASAKLIAAQVNVPTSGTITLT